MQPNKAPGKLLLASLLLAATPALAQPAGITAAPLAPPPVMADGLASPAESGLQNGLWSDVSFAAWQALLTALGDAENAHQTSPILRTLVASAIEARAALPGEGPAPASAADIALLRARALVPYVSAARFNVFVAAQNPANRGPALQALLRDMTFTADPARGCALLPTLNAPEDAAAPWTVFCQLMAGQANAVQVQIDALHESEPGSEAATDALRAIDTITTGNDKNGPDSLTLFAARLLGLSPTLKLDAPTIGPLAQRAKQDVLANRGGAGAPDAAEHLAGLGYAEPKLLTAAYDSVAFATVSEEAASPLHGAQRRAMLWQLLGKAADNNARARLVGDFINSGGAPALLGTRGAILSPLLAQMPATATFGWAAPNFFALAAAQDNNTAATAWYQNVQNLTATLPQATTWQTRLWPVAVAMGIDGADGLDAWVKDATALPDNARPPIAGILTLLEARGIVIDPATWQAIGEQSDTSLGGSGNAADPSQLALLHDAAVAASTEKGRQGEVILRAAIVAGNDPASAPVPTIAALIRALTQAGLNRAADRLTVEALLALLFPPGA